MDTYEDRIRRYLELEQDTLRALDTAEISRTAAFLEQCLREERTIYLFGNGGSAATASHFAVDFNKGISEFTEQKFRLHCLNDNYPTIMAIANDISYDEVFRFQLRGRLRPGDVVMALSGSGNSKNVLNAVEYAREQGCTVIGLTGYDGGRLYGMSDYHLHVPVMSIQVSEDVHMMYDHMLVAVLLEAICGMAYVRQ